MSEDRFIGSILAKQHDLAKKIFYLFCKDDNSEQSFLVNFNLSQNPIKASIGSTNVNLPSYHVRNFTFNDVNSTAIRYLIAQGFTEASVRCWFHDSDENDLSEFEELADCIAAGASIDVNIELCDPDDPISCHTDDGCDSMVDIDVLVKIEAHVAGNELKPSRSVVMTETYTMSLLPKNDT